MTRPWKAACRTREIQITVLGSSSWNIGFEHSKASAQQEMRLNRLFSTTMSLLASCASHDLIAFSTAEKFLVQQEFSLNPHRISQNAAVQVAAGTYSMALSNSI